MRNSLTSSRMRRRWASAVVRAGATARIATRTGLVPVRRSMRRASVAASSARPSVAAVTETEPSFTAKPAERASRRTPGNPGATAAAIVAGSRRTAICSSSTGNRSASTRVSRGTSARPPPPVTRTRRDTMRSAVVRAAIAWASLTAGSTTVTGSSMRGASVPSRRCSTAASTARPARAGVTTTRPPPTPTFAGLPGVSMRAVTFATSARARDEVTR